MLLHVTVYKEEGLFVAHSLDFDLTASGSSVGEAVDAIQEVILTYLEGCHELNIPFEKVKRPAPQDHWDRFEKDSLDPASETFFVRFKLPDFGGAHEQAATAIAS